MTLLWSKVKIVGLKIDGDVIGALMLGGLPDEYTPMVMGIENSGKAITADAIKTLLLQEVNFDVKPIENALVTKVKPKKFKVKKFHCFDCNEIGHIAKKCPKKSNSKQSKSENVLFTSFLAQGASNDSSNGSSTLVPQRI